MVRVFMRVATVCVGHSVCGRRHCQCHDAAMVLDHVPCMNNGTTGF